MPFWPAWMIELEGVSVFVEDVELHRSIPTHSAKAARSVSYVSVAEYLDHMAAKPLQIFFDRREMVDLSNWACAYHDIGPSGQHRFNEFWDVVCTILIVGVCVHDDIRACRNARFETGEKCLGKSLVRRQAYDQVDPVPLGDFSGPIPTPVIYNEPLDAINVGNLPRQGGQGHR